MIRGTLKADGVVVSEGSFSFRGTSITLQGKAAFVSTRTGGTYGWTECTTWSPETVAKLQELLALMEVDLGRIHLVEGGETVTGPSSLAGTEPRGIGGKGGIGEYVAGQI